MANQLFYGSINHDEYMAFLKSGKAKVNIVTRKDGSTFRSVDVNVWINEKPDQFKNDGSILVQTNEEAFKAGEKGAYIANIKRSTQAVKEATADDFNDDIDDDLPH